MQQQKQSRELPHCPHHNNVPLRRRRGTQSHKWIWYCPRDDCQYASARTKAGKVTQ